MAKGVYSSSGVGFGTGFAKSFTAQADALKKQLSGSRPCNVRKCSNNADHDYTEIFGGKSSAADATP